MSSSGFRERGFGLQGRFDEPHVNNQTNGPRQHHRGHPQGAFNTPRRINRQHLDIWTGPHSFYQHNLHNSPQSWQNRPRLQGNIRQSFRGGGNYPPQVIRGGFPRGNGGNVRFSNGRGHHQYHNQDFRWRFSSREVPIPSDKVQDPGPPPLGSEAERKQKITNAVDELKRKLLSNDGMSSDDIIWDQEVMVPGRDSGGEGRIQGVPGLLHGPPEIALTTNDLKDIGRVDLDLQKDSNVSSNDLDCEIIDVDRSTRSFREIVIHDLEDNLMDSPGMTSINPQRTPQDHLQDVSTIFPHPEGFLKSTNVNSLEDDVPGVTGNVSEVNAKPSRTSPRTSPRIITCQTSRSDKIPADPAKHNNFVNSNSPSGFPPHRKAQFDPTERGGTSPEDFQDRRTSRTSSDDPNTNKLRFNGGEFTKSFNRSTEIESRDFLSLHRSSHNINYPQKITSNISCPIYTPFTSPSGSNRTHQVPGYEVLQPPPTVFTPRMNENVVKLGNLIPDYNVITSGEYSTSSMMRGTSMEYEMSRCYGTMTNYVEMTYPPAVHSMDYPTPMAPAPPQVNSNDLNDDLNQIPMPSSGSSGAHEDEALGELKKAMEFAQKIMGMGNDEDITFQKECENGFDNFPTLPDLPPPLPPLPVPPDDDDTLKKSKTTKKKKKKKNQELETSKSTSGASNFNEINGILTSGGGQSSTPSVCTTSVPETVSSASPGATTNDEIVPPTREDRPRMTFSLQSKKLIQSNDWRKMAISPVRDIRTTPKPPPRPPPPPEPTDFPRKSEKIRKNQEIVTEKPENFGFQNSKKQLPTLDLMDFLKNSPQNLLSSPPSSTPQPPQPSDSPQDTSTTSRRHESTWKDRVIGRFLKMSKNDIKNMINNSNLRKFDIAMKHLVKEKKSSLSLEMRNTEDERIKSKELAYDKEDFIHQLKQILDPAATVDVSDLPTNFIHQLNEVLQLDVVPREDPNLEIMMSNPQTPNKRQIDDLPQLQPTSGINVSLMSRDIPHLGIDKLVTKATTSCRRSTVSYRGGKLPHDNHSSSTDSQQNHKNNNLRDLRLCTSELGHPEAGALIMEEVDDIFKEGITRSRISKAPRVDTPIVDRVDRIFNSGIAAAKAAPKTDDRMRSRKNSSDLDFFRNLTREEYDARYGESSHSLQDNSNRIMTPQMTRKSMDSPGPGDDTFVKCHHHSPGDNSHDDGTSDDGVSSSDVSDSSNEPSIDVSRMLRFIKEREKMAKKKSINEEIRDEVTAEIERKRKEKRALKGWRVRKREKRVKHRRERHHKTRKKKKKRNCQADEVSNVLDGVGKGLRGGRNVMGGLQPPQGLLREDEIKKEPGEETRGPGKAPDRLISSSGAGEKMGIGGSKVFEVKPTCQSRSGGTSAPQGDHDPSPRGVTPPGNPPAPSSPESSCSNGQNSNFFLKTKAQLKLMPEGMTTSGSSGCSGVGVRGERKGPSTPPHQGMTPSRGVNDDPEDSVVVKTESDDISRGQRPPGHHPLLSGGSSVFMGVYEGRGEGLKKGLEGKSSLGMMETTESARFTFLSKNKLMDARGIDLDPFVLGEGTRVTPRVPPDASRCHQECGSTSGGGYGAKGISKTKKLDFKAYQERALVKKLRAEGKIMLGQVLGGGGQVLGGPGEVLGGGVDHLNVSRSIDSSMSPVVAGSSSLGREIVRNNSEGMRLEDQRMDLEDMSTSKDIIIQTSDVFQGQITSSSGAGGVGARSIAGELFGSSDRKNKSGDISGGKWRSSSSSRGGGTSGQSDAAGRTSGSPGQEKNREDITSDGLPDVVPGEYVPEVKCQHQKIPQELISKNSGNIDDLEIEKTFQIVDSTSGGRPGGDEGLLGVLETTSTSGRTSPGPPKPLEPLKKPQNPEEHRISSGKSHSDVISHQETALPAGGNDDFKVLELLDPPPGRLDPPPGRLDPEEDLSPGDKAHQHQKNPENSSHVLMSSPSDVPPPPPDTSGPSTSPGDTPPPLPHHQEEGSVPEEMETLKNENSKAPDVNEKTDFGSLEVNDGTWRGDPDPLDPHHLDPDPLDPHQLDPDHLDPEILQEIPDSKEIFTESQENWQLDPETSPERGNVVLHDRALVVDIPRNTLLDDPVPFATRNNSPVPEGDASDEFGILCENDIQESIYDHQLVENSPMAIMNGSSPRLGTSFSPEDDGVDGSRERNDFNDVNQVKKELIDVKGTTSPQILGCLVLQGVSNDPKGVVNHPEGEEDDEDVGKISRSEATADENENLSRKLTDASPRGPAPVSRIQKGLDDGGNVQGVEEAPQTAPTAEDNDLSHQEVEDIKSLDEIERKIVETSDDNQKIINEQQNISSSDDLPRVPDEDVDPQVEVPPPEPPEHPLNSLMTGESPSGESSQVLLSKSSTVSPSPPGPPPGASLGPQDLGEVPSEAEKPQKTFDKPNDEVEISYSSKNHQNLMEINSSSPSGPSPSPSGPSPSPPGPSPKPLDPPRSPPAPSPPPEASKHQKKDDSRGGISEKSRDRHEKRKKDVNSLKKIHKLSSPVHHHKKHKSDDRKRSRITRRQLEDAIKSNVVVISQPTTKIGVMERMREIDIAIQTLMNEKMTLYQMLQNDEWPLVQVDVPEGPGIDEKSIGMMEIPGEKSPKGTKTPGFCLLDTSEGHQSTGSDPPSTKSKSSGSLPLPNIVKVPKNSRNDDKVSHKSKKRGRGKDDDVIIKTKELRRESPGDSALLKVLEDQGHKRDKKSSSKGPEEAGKRGLKVSQLTDSEVRLKLSNQKTKMSTICEEKFTEGSLKGFDKSSTRHKSGSGHLETPESQESSEVSRVDKRKKDSRRLKRPPESLLYSDDSTLDSTDRGTSDQKRATGLVLLEESMKRESGVRKTQDTKKWKEMSHENGVIDISKSIVSKKRHIQKTSSISGDKLVTSRPPGDARSQKHTSQGPDGVTKGRIVNFQRPGGSKKLEKGEKVLDKVEESKKKVKDDVRKSLDIKTETKPPKKTDTKFNLIDSDSSGSRSPTYPDSTASTDVTTTMRTLPKRLGVVNDEVERDKETRESKKSEIPSELKMPVLKAAILDELSDSSSSSSSKCLQEAPKNSQTPKHIIEAPEDRHKRLLDPEKNDKTKENRLKHSRHPDKGIKSKLNPRHSDKASSKERDRITSTEPKKDEKEKIQVDPHVGDESPIEGDDEDEEMSIKRRSTSRKSKKISSKRTNKSSSRSGSRSKRVLRSSSRESSPGDDKVVKRPRSGSSPSSTHSHKRSSGSKREHHLPNHRIKKKMVERSRDEVMNCRVEVVDCKYLLSLDPEDHPQVFKKLGISRINLRTPSKPTIFNQEINRSEEDCQAMIVVEVDDTIVSSPALELIEDGGDPEEDKMSEKSVCLGFPVSPRHELVDSKMEDQVDLAENKERVFRTVEGGSEGDVEGIDIKEEPILMVDSVTDAEARGDELNAKSEVRLHQDDEEPDQGLDEGDGGGGGDDEKDRMRYSAHKGPILDIKVFGDSFLAASEDGAIYRYSQKSNGILNIYKGHEAAVTCLYVHEIPGITESKKWFLFSGSLDASLRCYDVMGGVLNRPKVTVGSPIQCMDEAWGSIFIGTKSGHISRYDIKTGSLREDKLDFSDKPVLALRASTEGPRKILIVASRNQPITIRDAQSGLFLRTIAGQRTHTVYSLMRDRNLVYCGTSSTSIPVFDFISGEQVTQYTAGVGIVCMRLHQQLLFAGCYDGNIYVFDTKEPKLICSIPGPGNMLLSMEIIDETIIAGSKDRQLHAWPMPPSVRTILLQRT
ncbi:uncharacterized protein LOC135171449 isoform X2 [Diachasmimorpha longicaudata]|uniref:uncharacterized protein LOC135171449 isoform X2 n=1 Tax=Diachasmimorpha longicaudata TaxID=58733 RepID=UPI0030B8F8F7